MCSRPQIPLSQTCWRYGVDSQSDCQMYIAGEWTESETGARTDAFSPATGEKIGSFPTGSREDAQRAIAAANAASRGWARQTPFERAAVLERAAQIASERRDALARLLTLDQG